MTVYENIQEIAKDHGLSIKDVAKKAGIGENSIYRWQKKAPSITSLNKIAAALNVDIDDLTTNISEETPEFRAIQRRAKNLDTTQQKKLLKFMDEFFEDKYDKNS